MSIIDIYIFVMLLFLVVGAFVYRGHYKERNRVSVDFEKGQPAEHILLGIIEILKESGYSDSDISEALKKTLNKEIC